MIGKRIGILMAALRMTQKELAQLLGVSQPTISRILQDKAKLDAEMMRKLSAYFNLPLEGWVKPDPGPFSITITVNPVGAVRPDAPGGGPGANASKYIEDGVA